MKRMTTMTQEIKKETNEEHQKKVDYALRFLQEKIKDIKCTIAEAFEVVECFNFISSEIKKNENK